MQAHKYVGINWNGCNEGNREMKENNNDAALDKMVRKNSEGDNSCKN